MKSLMFFVTLLFVSYTVSADSREPLTDSVVGETATGKGWLLSRPAAKGPWQEYLVLVETDTGPQVHPAIVPQNFDVGSMLGRSARITAVICQRGTDPASRYLEITEIKIIDRKTK